MWKSALQARLIEIESPACSSTRAGFHKWRWKPMRTTALQTLESTGNLSATTLKRAIWEDLAATLLVTGETVNVANRSYGNGGVGHTYTVTLAMDGTPSSCTCPHNIFHAQICKHMAFCARQPLLLASAEAIQSRAARADGGALQTDGGVNVDAHAAKETEEKTTRREEPNVSGPYVGRDKDGHADHRYWVCENCGLETTDSEIKNGCWRCLD